MKPDRFLLAQVPDEERETQYILHTQFPQALIEVSDSTKGESVISKTYSYQLQNEVQPRHYTLRVTRIYEAANDWDCLLDEAWQWHLKNIIAA